MGRERTCVLVLALLAVAGPGSAGSPELNFELTGREDTLAVDNRDLNGLDGLTVDPDPASFALREGRVALSWPKARVHLQWSEEPDFEFTASRIWSDPPGAQTDTTANASDSATDLGLGYRWRPNGSWTLVPWLGLSRVEQRFRWHEDLHLAEELEQTNTLSWTHQGWGAGIGFDVAGSPLWPWLVVEARLVSRWTTGTTHAASVNELPPTGYQHTSESSAQTSVSMWGVEAGVGATVHGVTASLGWSQRDWSTDFGPGRVSGPYARLAVRF